MEKLQITSNVSSERKEQMIKHGFRNVFSCFNNLRTIKTDIVKTLQKILKDKEEK